MAYAQIHIVRNLGLLTLIIFTASLGGASNKRLCGKELTATLELICENNYNGFGKKSVAIDDYYNDQDADDELPYPYGQIPFLAKIRGGALMPKVRRLRHGVSDECCKKSCTYKELSSYCKYPQYSNL